MFAGLGTCARVDPKEQAVAADFTLGVEEEYQLICATTAELKSRAREVLEIDWSGEIVPEHQQSMLEVGTRVCANAQELDRELRRLRLQVASAAAAEGLWSVAAGVHPFSHWEDQTRTAGERYQRVLERYGRVVRTEQIFGMHIHVALPEGVDRAQVMNEVRFYIPHLLALSASSPIYEGEDTGYASYRTILAQRRPNTGPPPRFPSETDLRRFVDLLLRTGAIEDEFTLHWSIRPHPEYPTLEFRITDACPRVEDAVAIAAMVRALVAAAAQGRLPTPAGACSESATDALLSTNEWQAARYGLDAVLVDPGSEADKTPLRESVCRLLEHLQPVAEALGDEGALSGVETIMGRGNGADRIRKRLPASDDLPELARWLARESLLGVGLDRRTKQREELI
jgi:carboxylate-amine ligase